MGLWPFACRCQRSVLFTGSVKIKVNKPEVMNTEIVVEIVVAFEVNTYFCKHMIERLIQ